MYKINIAINSNDTLGEGPFWNIPDQTLWRVDIIEKKIYKWHPETNEIKEWLVPKQIGCFTPNKESSLGLVALENGLFVLNLKTNELNLIHNPKENGNSNRFNDAKCDRNGNYWVGTMDKKETSPSGNLFVLNKRKEIKNIMSGLIISNGIGWSPDNKIMYLTDSGKKTIWAFDFDSDNLEIANRRVFTRDKNYYPDGLVVDSKGSLWSAKWDGSCIVKYSQNGEVEEKVTLPVKRPTSITFGGKNLEKLFVTSASYGLKNNVKQSVNGCVLEILTSSEGIIEKTPNIFDYY